MAKDRKTKHPDGSICLEGTSSVPRRFKSCCDSFLRRTSACVYDVRCEWWPKKRIWVILIAESSGGGGIQIGHCPHCGARLSGVGGRARIKVAEGVVSRRMSIENEGVAHG